MSARILDLHYWNEEMYFLRKINIYILTSIDGANGVNAVYAYMAQPFLLTMSTGSNYIRRC